jgi:hypothetical protein
MRTFDSSLTRVKPVFDELYLRDSGGQSWLETLLGLPERFDGTSAPKVGAPGLLTARNWSEVPAEHGMPGGERRLKPPRSLLKWLVQHPDLLTDQLDELYRRAVPAEGEAGPAWVKRKLFLEGRDQDLEAEALEALSGSAPLPRGAWFVFEGPTSVDCYLETDRVVVTIEGKRTERRPTTTTEWLATRHQMLRNLDSALEIAAGRRVLAFFIVEGDAQGRVPDAWREWTDATISEHALDESLPHRSGDQRALLADGYLGATSWQLICDALALPRTLLIDKLEA